MFGGTEGDLFWAGDGGYDYLDGGDDDDCIGSSDGIDDVFNM